jgi:hypothetical protein
MLMASEKSIAIDGLQYSQERDGVASGTIDPAGIVARSQFRPAAIAPERLDRTIRRPATAGRERTIAVLPGRHVTPRHETIGRGNTASATV